MCFVSKGAGAPAKCVNCVVDRQACKTAIAGPAPRVVVTPRATAKRKAAPTSPSSPFAPAIAASASLPLPETSGSEAMDVDGPGEPRRKRSFIDLTIVSSKSQRMAASKGKARTPSVALSSSSLPRRLNIARPPLAGRLSLTPFETDLLLTRLDALETSVRRHDEAGTLERIDQIRESLKGSIA